MNASDVDQPIAGTSVTVGEYLDRIDFAVTPRLDATWLAQAQRRHLCSVPFENLDVYARVPVEVSTRYCLEQVVRRRRGGWCFVLNGAFAALLETLGFGVRRLGAAVLLGGPTTVIDHECLEVATPDGAFLVDVGFGDRGPTVPLPINSRQPINDGIAEFAFVDSSQGLTLTRTDDDGMVPLYRFRRVTLDQDAFVAPSQMLQSDERSPFRAAPFASILRNTPNATEADVTESDVTESDVTASDATAPNHAAWLTLIDGERKIVDHTGVSRLKLGEAQWRSLLDGFGHAPWPSRGP